MRNEIINLIEKQIKKNLFFLTGDLGFSVLESLKKKLRNRFINVGVSENNMFLTACGITIEKKKPSIFIFNFFILNSKKSRNN
jgi:transketolase C-terminal domain/subunit